MGLLRFLKAAVTACVFVMFGMGNIEVGAGQTGVKSGAEEVKDKNAQKETDKNNCPLDPPKKKGAAGVMQGGKLPEPIKGYSTGPKVKGNSGAKGHPVVEKLYDNVRKDRRSVFHGECAEASILCKIARDVCRIPDEGLSDADIEDGIGKMKDVCNGAKSSVYSRKSGYLKPCEYSCQDVLGELGIKAEDIC
ncbi:MAG: hypothetical protein FWG42_04635 [Clostridiales bacterium]|nr:hypothetical protein [Clostridiales bacterium]